MIDAWWNAAKDELLARGLRGESIGEQKIVRSSKNRVFKDDYAALAFLVEQGVPQSAMMEQAMKSPAEAVRQLVMLGKTKAEAEEMIFDYCVKPPGEPTLAALSDKRQALVIDSPQAWRDETATTDDEEI